MTPLPTGLLMAVALACALGTTTTLLAGQEATALELKASWLLQFARYATWPAAAFPPGAKLSICVAGDNRVADTLADLASRQRVQDRSVSVSRVKLNELKACHLLFWSGSPPSDQQALLEAVAGRPVLTVGDAPDFARTGGMINLFVEDRRMRFAINPGAATRAGLTISSKLLNLAEIRTEVTTGVRVAAGGGPSLPTSASPPPSTAPVYVGATIRTPTKVTHVDPIYPRLAQSARVAGDVVVETTIGVDGRVQSARVVQSIRLLDQAALDAVRQWTFTPTMQNGAPVAVIMTVTVTFRPAAARLNHPPVHGVYDVD